MEQHLTLDAVEAKREGDLRGGVVGFKVPGRLKGKQVYSLDLGQLVARNLAELAPCTDFGGLLLVPLSGWNQVPWGV